MKQAEADKIKRNVEAIRVAAKRGDMQQAFFAVADALEELLMEEVNEAE